MHTSRPLFFLVFLIFSISACSTGWLGADEGAPLEGERIAVLQNTASLEIAENVDLSSFSWPEPVHNQLWLQQGGNERNNIGHVAVPQAPERQWQVRAGSGNSDGQLNLSAPKIALQAAFVFDARMNLSAHRMDNGKRVWSVNLKLPGEDEAIVNGGTALGDRRLFAATGHGEVVALNPTSGDILWRRRLSAPVRSDPLVLGRIVYALTYDNQIVALNTEDGTEVWSYQGIPETTTILGGSGLVGDGSIVVAPFSNGEVIAFRADNGRILWLDTLAARRQFSDQVSNIFDIRARPAIQDGRLYVVSHANRMGAFDLATGRRLWDREVGSIESPLVVGEYLYLLDNQQKLICFEAASGKALWSRQLEAGTVNKPVLWNGPIAAGGHLVLAGSNGQLLMISPQSGEIVSSRNIGGRFWVPPVAALDTLLVLDEDARLTALR